MTAKITVDTSSTREESPITSGEPPQIQLVVTFQHHWQRDALLALKRAYDSAVRQIEETA